MIKKFFTHYWGRPRSHVEIDDAREVTFLELFYDLVYVVVISRAAHLLIHDVSVFTIVNFFILFGLVWIAWVNGTLYLDYHGKEDLRTRFYTFLQMLVLTVVSFYADSPIHDNFGFVIFYTVNIGIMFWLWLSALLVDLRHGHRQFTGAVIRYLLLLIATAGALIASQFVSLVASQFIAGGIILVWIIVFAIMNDLSSNSFKSTPIHKSTAERFGLFIIIVLGEIVVGIGAGIQESGDSASVMLTSALVLIIGFGLWWNYFDYVGMKIPRNTKTGLPLYIISHLPLSLSITTIGALAPSVLHYSMRSSLPQHIALLLSGLVALYLLALEMSTLTLKPVDLGTDVDASSSSGGQSDDGADSDSSGEDQSDVEANSGAINAGSADVDGSIANPEILKANTGSRKNSVLTGVVMLSGAGAAVGIAFLAISPTLYLLGIIFILFAVWLFRVLRTIFSTKG